MGQGRVHRAAVRAQQLACAGAGSEWGREGPRAWWCRGSRPQRQGTAVFQAPDSTRTRPSSRAGKECALGGVGWPLGLCEVGLASASRTDGPPGPRPGAWRGGAAGPAPARALAKPRVGQGSGGLTSLCRQPWGLGYDGWQCDSPYEGVGVQSLPRKWLPRGS